MKHLIAFIVLLGFVVLGVWVGVFVMFAPGLAEVIRQCQTEVTPSPMSWAVVKMLLAWPTTVFIVTFGASFHKEIMK